MSLRRLAALGGGVAAAAAALQAERRPCTASAAAAPQRLWCWGRLVPSAGASAPPPADDDPAGTASTPRLKERSPVDVSFWSAQGLRVEQMSFGAAHAAALDDRGNVWAWGANGSAGGATPTRLAPPPRGKYTSLASTDGSLYAVTSGGAVLRWAHLCDSFAPGPGPGAPPPPAVLGGNLAGVAAAGISAGSSHVLVRSTAGQLYVFGGNERGQLGVGAMPDELEGLLAEQAQQVSGLPPGIKVVQIACGRAHSVALLADGTVYSWGDDRNLQLGVRDDSIKSLKRGAQFLSSPTRLSGTWIEGKRALAIAAGGGGIEGGHSVFLLEDTNSRAQNSPHQNSRAQGGGSDEGGGGGGVAGRVEELWACGHGRWGQLGNKAYTHISGPIRVSTLAKLREWDEGAKQVVPIRITSLSCGDRHTAAVLSSGNLFTWGWNEAGQLGSGNVQGSHTPAMIKAPAELRLSRVSRVACGPNSTCAW